METGNNIKTKADIFRLLKKNRERIASLGAQRIGLFGSFAAGNPKQESDIDILVEFRPGTKNFKNYTDLYFFLSELLERKIDFVTPESLSPYIGPYILKQVEYVPLGD